MAMQNTWRSVNSNTGQAFEENLMVVKIEFLKKHYLKYEWRFYSNKV